MNTNEQNNLKDIALRIREMRSIFGYSEAEMAEKTEVSISEYRQYEKGELDFPFSFIHKCTRVFDVGISDLLEGHSAKLSSYTVTRRGGGESTASEDGIEIQNLAPMFREKIGEPYYVRYDYRPELQDKPIALKKHAGQEFDYIISGHLKVQIGDRIEYLSEGDSIFYNSSTPHGMIAVEGKSCYFIAMILPGRNVQETLVRNTLIPSMPLTNRLICSRYIETEEENGSLKSIRFKNEETFNFAFDIVDEIARKDPEKIAMIHLDKFRNERRFTFKDMKKASNQCANYFTSLGLKKGDRVLLILKRHYQFWPVILALHKIGAVGIPATSQLKEKDIEYRLNKAEIKAVICTTEDNIPGKVNAVQKDCPSLKLKVCVTQGTEFETPEAFDKIERSLEGWRNLDDEYTLFSSHFDRTENSPCGDDVMIMFFTSGTTGYPKIVEHSYKYALGHFVTAKYWHGVSPEGLHFTISETGWGKALWGKLYGQWMCEGSVFTYDFDRFSASDILPLFAKYKITTFCAPPTMLRMMIKEDISKYDLSSIVQMTTAGEALNPEVYKQFEKITGLRIMEGFGQTETTLVIANLVGVGHKIGSMGKASPLYDIALMAKNGTMALPGETGEIVVKTKDGVPCGLFKGYFREDDATNEVWHDGYYHTRDLAWMDEDGYFWYVGRADDVIKSSGYRIGPFEIESTIMELPYVLECGVSAAPDPVRGQVVKASIVLVKGKEPSDDLVKEIQEYVKNHTAPYKYPRIVVFRDSLPKTISGKIKRNEL